MILLKLLVRIYCKNRVLNYLNNACAENRVTFLLQNSTTRNIQLYSLVKLIKIDLMKKTDPICKMAVNII